jgi:sigma-B regulation protein RsbU (phosphoserine phosphatase)
LASRLQRAEQEIHSLSSEILERYEEATLIYRLSERLGSVLGENAISRLVIEDAARTLGARAGEVWLTEDEAVVLAASVPPGRPIPWNRDEEGAQTALRENRPWTLEAGDGREPVAAVPLPSPSGDPVGALVLRGRSDNRSYRSGEIKLLTALAALTSAFIRNDRLAAEARRSEARRREDEITRQIHRSLLPAGDPAFHGLEISGRCLAAEKIGGDFYGFIAMPDGSMGVAMADVSGHGVGAALYMAAAKGALQAEARRVYAPGDLLRRVNEALIADFSKSDVFATAFFVRFYPGGRRFSFANGGHNPALLVRSGGGVELLERGGAALGVLPDMVYEEDIRRFAEGDLLVVYTDGLVEARDAERRFYGMDRLTALVREHRGDSAQRIRQRLLEDLSAHCGPDQHQDDVTVVVVRAVAESSSGSTGEKEP